VPLPIAHAAVGASIAAVVVSRGDPQRLQKIALGALLGIAPDFDFFFVWILHWGREWHRGFAHSILFALASGAITYLGLRFFKRQPRDLLAYCLAMMSHGVLDAIFSVGAGGVELFWPFSQSRYRFGFSRVLESDLTPHSLLTQSVLEAVIFLPMFAAVLWFTRPPRQ
jgi:inner membrane protein